jgi:Icc protein
MEPGSVARDRRDEVATRRLARLDRPAGPESRVAIVADPHLTETAHGTLKMFHRTKQRFRTAVGDTRRLEPDGVVVAGDLTENGTDAEYSLADRLLGGAPSPQVVVPGNHDVSPPEEDGSETPATLAARYGHDGYPVTARLGGVSVLGIDSTVPGRIRGCVDRERLQQTLSRCDETPGIAVLHHPIAPLPAAFRDVVDESAYGLEQGAAVADSLAAAGVELVVSAHLHWPFVTRYRGLTIVGAPGAASFPPSYLLVETDPEGTTVSLVPLAGPKGIREAYEYAIDDEIRGRAIERVVSERDRETPSPTPL